MRLAYVVHQFPPQSVGGTEVYSWGLARAIAARGHEVHIFYPLRQEIRGATPLLQDGLWLWRIPLPDMGRNPARAFWHTFRNATVEAEFARFLTTTKPDLVHFQHLQGVSGRLFSLATPCPRVVTLHDYWYFCANSQLIKPDGSLCSGPRGGWRCGDCGAARAGLALPRALQPTLALPFAYRNRFLQRQMRGVECYIASSHFVRDTYVREGWPAERIIVIEHGLDYSRLASTGQPISVPIRPHFVFLGSIAWQKGVHVLIKAFNKLSELTSLTIYGDTTLFPDYVAYLETLVRHPHVRFAGVLDHRRIGDALRSADYLVVPSLWHETFCLVAQEAHGVRVPVVASRLGALPERVWDGVNGRLFQAGDSDDLARVLRDLIAHPEYRAQCAAQIKEPPSIEQHADRLLAVYDELLATRRPLH